MSLDRKTTTSGDLLRLEHVLPSLPRDRTSLFLDCDGTLAEIVDRPDMARVEPGTLSIVHRLDALLDGALAIISGRSLDDIDRLFAPHRFAAAGTHGVERRPADGRLLLPPVDATALSPAQAALDAYALRHQGILVERKPRAVALHYRLREDLTESALAVARSVLDVFPTLTLRHGKAVVELGLGTETKADAIEAFMGEAPFRGRTPFFIGDDLTDEDGFRTVRTRGGVAIKVGAGPTLADYRLDDPAAVGRWLASLAANWETTSQNETPRGAGG